MMTDIGDMIERGSDGPEWAQHRHDAAWREITDQAKALAENAALRVEVERLREERRWIPVEERLPEFEVPVFLREKCGAQYIGCLSHDEVGECWCRADGEPWYDGDGWSCYADVGDYKPTHWHTFPQPLPAQPDAG
jgi:hypothetical protein